VKNCIFFFCYTDLAGGRAPPWAHELEGELNECNTKAAWPGPTRPDRPTTPFMCSLLIRAEHLWPSSFLSSLIAPPPCHHRAFSCNPSPVPLRHAVQKKATVSWRRSCGMLPVPAMPTWHDRKCRGIGHM
jgi:hypothetical protein